MELVCVYLCCVSPEVLKIYNLICLSAACKMVLRKPVKKTERASKFQQDVSRGFGPTMRTSSYMYTYVSIVFEHIQRNVYYIYIYIYICIYIFTYR